MTETCASFKPPLHGCLDAPRLGCTSKELLLVLRDHVVKAVRLLCLTLLAPPALLPTCAHSRNFLIQSERVFPELMRCPSRLLHAVRLALQRDYCVEVVGPCRGLLYSFNVHSSMRQQAGVESACTWKIPCLAQPLGRPHICSNDMASSIGDVGAGSRLSRFARGAGLPRLPIWACPIPLLAPLALPPALLGRMYLPVCICLRLARSLRV